MVSTIIELKGMIAYLDSALRKLRAEYATAISEIEELKQVNKELRGIVDGMPKR